MGTGDDIKRLESKIQVFSDLLEDLQSESVQLKKQIASLKEKQGETSLLDQEKEEYSVQSEVPTTEDIANSSPSQHVVDNPAATAQPATPSPSSGSSFFSFTDRASLERFIGENLINKIGILVMVLGVGFGANYAIEHELISPLLRIILGYIAGAILAGTAYYLRANYFKFSAVLFSGSVSIFYFITFFAHSFYGFIPAIPTFALMVGFTVLAAILALWYNALVIALLGMVGAYAVPFLISTESESATVLFSYVSVINIGLLYIGVYKYWRLVYSTAFVFTSGIFLAWLFNQYQYETGLTTGFIFSSVNYITFICYGLAYKLFREIEPDAVDFFSLLSAVFLYLFVGLFMLGENSYVQDFRGVFVALIGLSLFGFYGLLQVFKVEKHPLLLLFIKGLAVGIITLAVPIEFSLKTVIAVWCIEGAFLFWFGSRAKERLFFLYAYIIITLSLVLLLFQYADHYVLSSHEPSPFVHILFFTSLLSFGVVGWVVYQIRAHKDDAFFNRIEHTRARILFSWCLGIWIYVLLMSELNSVFRLWYIASEVVATVNVDTTNIERTYTNRAITWYGNVARTLFSLAYIYVLLLLNERFIRSKHVQNTLLVAFAFLSLYVLSSTLYVFKDLRDLFLSQDQSEFYYRGVFLLLIRYIILIPYVFLLKHVLRTFQNHPKESFKSAILPITSGLILWLLSAELIHWLSVAGYDNAYELALSILWGTYALILVIIGIFRNKAILRYTAMALFAITLGKLFLYDLANLTAIAKTVVLVVLGLLLLIFSFLYNKYSSRLKASD
ncbi:MAG: DUF2339 domain-containing protein [Bacteroidota bacterium]